MARAPSKAIGPPRDSAGAFVVDKDVAALNELVSFTVVGTSRKIRANTMVAQGVKTGLRVAANDWFLKLESCIKENVGHIKRVKDGMLNDMKGCQYVF